MTHFFIPQKVANCRFAQFVRVFSPFHCAITKYLQTHRYGNHFVTIFEGVETFPNGFFMVNRLSFWLFLSEH